MIQTLTSEENLKGHFLGKLQGRNKASAMRTKASQKCDEGCTFETSYNVHRVAFLCVGKCVANNPAFPNGMGEISVLRGSPANSGPVDFASEKSFPLNFVH